MKAFKSAVLAIAFLTCSVATANDTVILVLDASGSMQDQIRVGKKWKSKMQVAKEACARVLPLIPPTTDLGVLVFSASNVSDEESWIYPVGKVDTQKLLNAIRLPEPGGGTPLGEFMRRAENELLQRRKKNSNAGKYKMIVVTDGEASDPGLVEQVVPDIKRKGVVINLIGLAMSSEHSLAQMVRSYPTPGTYDSASDIKSLVDAVSTAIAEEPINDSGGIDEEAYQVYEGLDTAVANAMTQSISTFNNAPFGHPDEQFRVDNSGNITQVVAQSADQTIPSGSLVGMLVAMLLVGGVLFAFLLFVIMNS